MMPASPKIRGIDDYRLLTALSADQLQSKVHAYESMGWHALGVPHFLHSGRDGVQDVYIQPLVHLVRPPARGAKAKP